VEANERPILGLTARWRNPQMTATLSELSKLSKQLNEDSKRVNDLITQANNALESMNLGVETWLKQMLWRGEYFAPVPDWAPVQGSYADNLGSDEDTGTATARNFKAVQLGYAKTENGYQVAVRSVTIEEYGESAERIVNPGDPQPLIKASRNLRIDALALLPQLTDAIKDRVQGLLSNIEKAKNIGVDIGAQRTYIVRILPGDKYEIVYEGGHQRQAGELRHLRTFLEQSAIASGEDLERIERELREKSESKITVVWGKFSC
jgi:hypothetical protein